MTAEKRFAEQLSGCGFSAIETVSFPADGETVFGDKRMPYAWEPGTVSLYVICPDGSCMPFADTARATACAVRGSTALPEGGVEATLYTEAQFLAGEDATGSFVMPDPEQMNRSELLTAVLDRGGYGLVTDWSADPFGKPDVLGDVRGMTENGNESADAETRPFTAFVVTPRRGMRLRTLAGSGVLRVKAMCTARRFAGVSPVLTGVVPGRSAREVWFLATFASLGAPAAVKRLCISGVPAFTLRIVAAEDRPGLSAWLATRRDAVRPICVYGCDAASRGLADGVRGMPDAICFASSDGVVPSELSFIPAAQPPPESPWRAYAAGMIPSRLTPDLPQDLVRVPRAERPTLAVPVAEGALAHVIAGMDGRRTLAEIMAGVETRLKARIDADAVKRIALFVARLSEYGYFACSDAGAVHKADLIAAMRAAGVRAGDLLIVHSSLSAFGHIVGGAATALAALREAVGSEGTVLFPAFCCSYRIFANVNKRMDYRPYDPSDISSMRWIGVLPMAFLRAHPDAPRTRHPTNAWTGFGPLAAECFAAHGPEDPPFGATSPLAQALARKGKTLFLGADLTSCSFLHHLEDVCDLPGLAPALVSVKGADGRPHDVAVPRHVPGPRAFYKTGENARFFREAKAAGLVIGRAKLGLGEVKLIDLEQLYRIGKELCRRDPYIIMDDGVR